MTNLPRPILTALFALLAGCATVLPAPGMTPDNVAPVKPGELRVSASTRSIPDTGGWSDVPYVLLSPFLPATGQVAAKYGLPAGFAVSLGAEGQAPRNALNQEGAVSGSAAVEVPLLRSRQVHLALAAGFNPTVLWRDEWAKEDTESVSHLRLAPSLGAHLTAGLPQGQGAIVLAGRMVHSWSYALTAPQLLFDPMDHPETRTHVEVMSGVLAPMNSWADMSLSVQFAKQVLVPEETLFTLGFALGASMRFDAGHAGASGSPGDSSSPF